MGSESSSVQSQQGAHIAHSTKPVLKTSKFRPQMVCGYMKDCRKGLFLAGNYFLFSNYSIHNFNMFTPTDDYEGV